MAAQTEEVAGDMVGHTKTQKYLRQSQQGSQLIGYSGLRERILVFQLWATDRPKWSYWEMWKKIESSVLAMWNLRCLIRHTSKMQVVSGMCGSKPQAKKNWGWNVNWEVSIYFYWKPQFGVRWVKEPEREWEYKMNWEERKTDRQALGHSKL